MNNEMTIENQKSDQETIPNLMTDFLNKLDNIKSSDPELYQIYKARLLNLLSDARTQNPTA